MAAEHKDNIQPSSLYDEVNVQGARNVCEAAKVKNVRTIVFTSSVAVYGFAPLGTAEDGDIKYFNDYGRTKWEAEQVYKAWYEEDSLNRNLFIVRPTVVFGERNRGNVYNLLKQIASGKFLMIGNGKNRKSMAYVENVAAFLEYGIKNAKGHTVTNYVDTPDFNMNDLVTLIRSTLNKGKGTGMRFPYWIGYFGGLCFDFLSKITKKEFPVSSIRVKKFCANTMFSSAANQRPGFKPAVTLEEGLRKTLNYEFIENNEESLFYSE